ncbi:MAG: SdpI family protein [Bacteroidia bacterium]
MKKSKLFISQALVLFLPLVYFIFKWTDLPAEVPVHFDGTWQVNRWGSKYELLGTLVFIALIAFGTSILINNISFLDPKKKLSSDNPIVRKISWVIVVFMAVISALIVNSSINLGQGLNTIYSMKYFFALFAILFLVLGNLMNNIKQNYFIGFRTPWNLEDESNWKKTHHLASKLWFFGGLTLLIMIMLFNESSAKFILMIGLIPMVLIPFIYSYKLYKSKDK